MKLDLISVIVPIYNVEKFLERCLNSIIEQSYENIEIILVDDGSKDNSGKICDLYAKKDKRIKVFHIENKGVSNARNIGARNANGNYLLFVDADDTINVNMIEKMYNILNREQVDIVKSNYIMEKNGQLINNSELLLEGKFEKKEIQNFIIKNILQEKIRCYIWLLLIKKDLFEGFDERLFIFEDANIYLDLLGKAESIYITKEILYNYNVSNINSATKSNELYKKNIFNMILASGILKDTLKRYGLDNDCNSEIIDTRIINDIINYLYLIYRKNNSIKELQELFNKLVKNEYFNKMLTNFNSNFLTNKERIFAESLIKGNKVKFYFLCKIKNLINKKRL